MRWVKEKGNRSGVKDHERERDGNGEDERDKKMIEKEKEW